MIGRECDGILLDDEKVSRRHVELEPTANGLVVRDAGSTNGTLVDSASFGPIA